MKVGIVGLGLYLPKNKMTAAEISAATGGNWTEDAVINKLGIVEKYVPSADPCDGTQEMGALAALDCLKNTGVDPLEIDAILCITEEWKDYPDGIKIEEYRGDYFSAYIMLIKDPDQVYLATSTTGAFSKDKPGTRINNAIETEKAAAAINAGAFFDNGTSSSVVGSVPQGLVVAGGKVVWESGSAPEEGFVGFNQDNILMVAKTMTGAKAMELGIRDGCCFGPALIINGEQNMEAYNNNSGWNPRTAIGQRADGAVIFVCIDGRQTSSLGGSYADIINIMVEYGAVNACNMDGGSSSVMLYRDTYGLYGEAGQVQMINNYSLLQSQPRRMPNFWMVRKAN